MACRSLWAGTQIAGLCVCLGKEGDGGYLHPEKPLASEEEGQPRTCGGSLRRGDDQARAGEPGCRVQFRSVTQSCPTLRPHGLQHARLPCSSPSLGAYSTHVHRVGDAIQPSHALSFPSPAFNLSQHRVFSNDCVGFSSVQFSSVVSDSLRPHELQHARPPCPSPTPGVHPNLGNP